MYESCPSFAIELQVKQCQSACTVSFCNKRMLPCTSRPLRGHGCAVCNRFRGSRDHCSSGRCSTVDRLVTQTRSLAKFPTASRICTVALCTASEGRIAVCASDWNTQLGIATRKGISAWSEVTRQYCTSRRSHQWTSFTGIPFRVLRAHTAWFRWRSRVCNSYMHLTC